MPRRFTAAIRLGILLGACCFVSFGDAGYPEKDIRQREATVARWDRQASLQSGIEILVIVLGAAITVVQGIQKGWTKPATITMAAFTTILSAVNSKVFPTDRRTLQASVVKANRVITRMHRAASDYADPQLASARQAFSIEIEKALSDFDDIDIEVTGGSRPQADPAKVPGFFLPVVFAAEPDNACGLQPRQDSLRHYFIGTSKSGSIGESAELSRKAAIDAATRELTPKGLDPAAVHDILEKLAVVEDTSYRIEGKSAQFTHCTMIRVNRTAENLLRTAPPAKAVSKTFSAEPRAVARLSTALPQYIYVRKIRNPMHSPALAEVYIVDSPGEQWLGRKLSEAEFQTSLAHMTESSGGQLAPGNYLRAEVKKGDAVTVKRTGGGNLTVNFSDVKYVLNRIDYTVSAQ